MIDRILKIFPINYGIEDRGWLWGLISNRIKNVDINENNLDNMCIDDLTLGIQIESLNFINSAIIITKR